MVDSATLNNAVLYLMFCSPIVFLTALGMLLQEVMNVLGFQTARAALGAINVGVNLIVSILCVAFLPADMKLAGLGIGTSAGGLAEFIGGIVILRILKVRLGYRPLILRPREIAETVRCGFPAAADYFAENVLMGIQNNLILAGFPGDAMILPTAEVVCNITYFASGTIKGAAIATEPLFGVFFAERDVNSIRKVWQQGWVMGICMSVVWAVLFYVSLPLLSALCGMELSQDISRGVFLCMIFTPVMHTVYMFTLYYEATKHFNLSMAFAIIPDSCLYALMMAFLIPIIGKDGIWLAITGNQVIGLIILIPLVLFISAKTGRGMDRLLLLPEEFYTGTMLLESEILGDKTDVAAEMEMVREPLQSVLSDKDKTDAVMHCAVELVSDMLQSSKHIHIKLREEGEKTELFIRSLGKRRNMPESISENAMNPGDNSSISYSYVYKMNIACITLAGRC
jgi:Na+-driven multidrug efflux pump